MSRSARLLAALAAGLALGAARAGAGDADPAGDLEALLRAARARVEQGIVLAAAEEAEIVRLATACGPALASEASAALAAPGEPAARAAALARLGERAATVRAEAGQGVAPPVPREALERVLARREFAGARAGTGDRRPRELSGPWLALLERFWDWLDGLLRKGKDAGRPEAPGLGSRPLALALAGAVALLLALALRRWAAESRRAPAATAAAPPAPGAGAAEEALSRDPDQWLELADRCLGGGDAAGAVRAFYLALLVSLHRAGAIEVRPARTNWEHARALAARRPTAAADFRELCALFDRVVYGRRAVAAADYLAARTLGMRLLEAAARAGPAGRTEAP